MRRLSAELFPLAFRNSKVMLVIMLSKRAALVLTAICTIAVCGATAFAADLTLFGRHRPPSPVPPQAKGKQDVHPEGKNKPAGSYRPGRKKGLTQAELQRQRRIVTYSLLREPLSRLGGGLADHRRVDITERWKAQGPGALGTGYGPAGILNGTSGMQSARTASLVPAEQDNESIAFGCRERPFASSVVRRELTACFRTSVDRSWKAQTYVSRGYTEGTQTWGGGLTLAHDY